MRLAIALGAIATSWIVACTIRPDPLPQRPGRGTLEEETDGGGGPVPSSRDGGVREGGVRPGGPVPQIFAHSANNLVRLDPTTRAVTLVGPLTGCDALLDLASDKAGSLVGASSTALFDIDSATGACTRKAAQGSLPALTFAPAGVVDAAAEVLVGYTFLDKYVKVDPATGQTTELGQLNPVAASRTFTVSGDIVIYGDGRAFVAAHTGTEQWLVAVDPKTGQITREIGNTNSPRLYGLGGWGAKLYGFSENAEVFEIDPETGGATKVTFTALSGVTEFNGAAMTTLAPSR